MDVGQALWEAFGNKGNYDLSASNVKGLALVQKAIDAVFGIKQEPYEPQDE